MQLLRSHWSHFNGELVFTVISLAGSQRFPNSIGWWMGVCRSDACEWFNTEGWSWWHQGLDLSPPMCPSFTSLSLSGDRNVSGTKQHFSTNSYSPRLPCPAPFTPSRLPTSSPPWRLRHLLFLHHFAPVNRCTRRQQTPARGGKSCFLVCHYHRRRVFQLQSLTHQYISQAEKELSAQVMKKFEPKRTRICQSTNNK